jgi:hypothetical protein
MEGRTRYSRMSAERLARLVHQRVTSLAFRFACVCTKVKWFHHQHQHAGNITSTMHFKPVPN